MGIPKFYRWLSERYPLVNQPIAETNVPVVDNLYLDMNGIIHNCTHGNDPGRKITEQEMIIKVFGYLEKLFQIVQPQKLLFMAIDGVAPRAKMNQQRSRRFKTAKERLEIEKEKISNGEEPAGPDAFDSNCITPGTPFMQRLGEHLRFFIRKKISEDVAWQVPVIVFSGHDVPGEGEHKIMEYIRLAKLRDDYKPNLRHCMYGLDADLIMLALVSHEPHFCLLREVVKFGGGNKGQPAREILDNPCAEHFILFQIGLVRDYLELEFQNAALPFPFILEHVVDDFVLFCMLIGNDFLPSLPTLDINEGALDKIFAIYKKMLPTSGYLTHAGQLHADRLEALLQHLALLEQETLEQRAADAEWFEAKQSKRKGGGQSNGMPSRQAASEVTKEDEFEAALAGSGLGENPVAPAENLAMLGALEEDEAPKGPTMMGREARQLILSGQGAAGLTAWKERYYGEKLHINVKNPVSCRKVVEDFVQGIRWVMEYYYRGVVSWDWFYPHHYAPMISDMTGLAQIRVAFEPGQPFRPFQQLLAVLPAASAKLLPSAYQDLMTNPHSPIVDFYPPGFEMDMEGKRAEWEAIVLIPFINQQRLLAAEASIPPGSLTEAERTRNQPGSILIFSHDNEAVNDSAAATDCTSTLPSHFASIARCNSRMQRSPPPAPLPHGQPGFTPTLVRCDLMMPLQRNMGTTTIACARQCQAHAAPVQGTARVLPGYPTLRTLGVTAALKTAAVEVLGQPSKKESLILTVKNQLQRSSDAAPTVNAALVGPTLTGQRCWVRWPYLQEAIVEGVSDSTEKVDNAQGSTRHSSETREEWNRAVSKIGRDFLIKEGLDVGNCDIMLHVRVCEGLVRQLDGTIEKRFARKELLYPIQATLRRNTNPDPRLDPEAAKKKLGDLQLTVGSKAIFVGRSHFGCVATVIPDASRGLSKQGKQLEVAGASGLLSVSVQPADPSTTQAAQRAKHMLSTSRVQYMPSGLAAKKLGLSPRTLGKITGNLFMLLPEGREDVGLYVKHGNKGLCVPDYVRAQPEERGWAYSSALVQVLEQYKKRHAWVFSMLEANPEGGSEYDVAEALPGYSTAAQTKAVADIRQWLKSLPLSRRQLCKSSSQVAPEEAIKTVQMVLAPSQGRPLPPVHLENVSLGLLLPPPQGLSSVAAAMTDGPLEIGDRVASLSSSSEGPPLGLRGLVVGIYDEACEVLFDEVFPGGNDLQGRCRGERGAILPGSFLLNLSQQQPVTCAPGTGPKLLRRSAAPQDVPGAESRTNGSVAGDSPPDGAPPAPGSLPMPSFIRRAARSKDTTPVKQRPPVKPQPICPPNALAKGFTMGRGRPLPTSAPTRAPGSNPAPPASEPPVPVSLLNGAASLPALSAPVAAHADGSPGEPVADDAEQKEAAGEAEAAEPSSPSVEQPGATAATPPPAVSSTLQASTAQRAPSPAFSLTALPPGLATGPVAPHPQSAAAALQQAGLAAPAQPGQQPWQQPPDQGAALLAHLQSQARGNMGQMRPQDPSGAMLLQMLQQQQQQQQHRQQQVFPGPQPVAMPGHPGPLSEPGTAQSLGLQQAFAPVGQAQRPALPPFPVGGGGIPQMAPSAGQALLSQLRSAAQAQPQPQGRPDQLTSAGAALLAQLQAASRSLQPQPQQPSLAQQPNAAGANLLAQLQARSLAQQQQAMPQAAGLTNPGMNLLAQLQRVSGGLPSGGGHPAMHASMNGLAGLNLNAQRGLPGQGQQLGRGPGMGQPQQQEQSVMSAEALYMAQLQRMSQPAQAPQQHHAASGAGQPNFLHLLQQGSAPRPAGTPQPHLQPLQTSGNMNPAASSGDMTALWLKLQQQHAQEAVAGRQQQIPMPQQPLPLQPGLQNLGMLRAGQPGGLPNAGSIPQQQQQQGMAPGGFRTSQPSQAENDFWQQLQKR